MKIATLKMLGLENSTAVVGDFLAGDKAYKGGQALQWFIYTTKPEFIGSDWEGPEPWYPSTVFDKLPTILQGLEAENSLFKIVSEEEMQDWISRIGVSGTEEINLDVSIIGEESVILTELSYTAPDEPKIVHTPVVFTVQNQNEADVAIAETNNLMTMCHEVNVRNGWWDNVTLSEDVVYKIQKLGLVHSEVSEAIEGVRKGKMDKHLPGFSEETVELADAMIRILDYAEFYNLHLAEALIQKLQYNISRADHQPANRALEGGKKA